MIPWKEEAELTEEKGKEAMATEEDLPLPASAIVMYAHFALGVSKLLRFIMGKTGLNKSWPLSYRAIVLAEAGVAEFTGSYSIWRLSKLDPTEKTTGDIFVLLSEVKKLLAATVKGIRAILSPPPAEQAFLVKWEAGIGTLSKGLALVDEGISSKGVWPRSYIEMGRKILVILQEAFKWIGGRDTALVLTREQVAQEQKEAESYTSRFLVDLESLGL